jgi:hypothetical protein
MKYLTNRGEFATLQLLRAAYLDAPDWQKFWIDARTITEQPWTKGLLHASDVGGCPRATMYRLLDTPEKPRGEKSKANRKVMFWAGYHFHYLTYSALSWAGILLYHEEPVKLPDGWTGTLDAEIVPLESDTFVFDEKTVMPNTLNYGYDLPKLPNCLQLTVYGDAVDNLNGLLEYTDRAGSNDPRECPVDLSEYVEAKNTIMKTLETQRDMLPELPPELEQVYVPHYTRDKSDPDWMVMKTIAVETPWNCGYCDYHLTREESRVNPASGRMKKYSWTQPESTCHPHNVPPVDVAELSPVGTLISCKSGHEVGAEIVTRTKPLRYYSPQDEP